MVHQSEASVIETRFICKSKEHPIIRRHPETIITPFPRPTANDQQLQSTEIAGLFHFTCDAILESQMLTRIIHEASLNSRK